MKRFCSFLLFPADGFRFISVFLTQISCLLATGDWLLLRALLYSENALKSSASRSVQCLIHWQQTNLIWSGQCRRTVCRMKIKSIRRTAQDLLSNVCLCSCERKSHNSMKRKITNWVRVWQKIKHYKQELGDSLFSKKIRTYDKVWKVTRGCWR